jgi:Tol biopolymer transport system component
LTGSLACTGSEKRTAHTLPSTAGREGAAFALVYEQVVAGNRDLYVVSPSGGLPQRLTDHPGEDSMPRWSANGKRVIFATDRTGHWQIWEVPATGGSARPIRENEATEFQVDESPSGSHLAFLSNAENAAEYLWLRDQKSGVAQVLLRYKADSILGNPDWSPDGQEIVFSSNHRYGHQIYRVDVRSTETRRVSPITSGGCEPRFHPDGRRVVYVSRRHFGKSSLLVEQDLETGAEKTLVGWPALNYDPAYSPDGQELAFASNISGQYQVYRQRLSDGKAWQVTFGAGEARYPDYRPVP